MLASCLLCVSSSPPPDARQAVLAEQQQAMVNQQAVILVNSPSGSVSVHLLHRRRRPILFIVISHLCSFFSGTADDYAGNSHGQQPGVQPPHLPHHKPSHEPSAPPPTQPLFFHTPKSIRQHPTQPLCQLHPESLRCDKHPAQPLPSPDSAATNSIAASVTARRPSSASGPAP